MECGTRDSIMRQFSRGNFGLAVARLYTYHPSVNPEQLSERRGVGLRTARKTILSTAQIGERSATGTLQCQILDCHPKTYHRGAIMGLHNHIWLRLGQAWCTEGHAGNFWRKFKDKPNKSRCLIFHRCNLLLGKKIMIYLWVLCDHTYGGASSPTRLWGGYGWDTYSQEFSGRDHVWYDGSRIRKSTLERLPQQAEDMEAKGT